MSCPTSEPSIHSTIDILVAQVFYLLYSKIKALALFKDTSLTEMSSYISIYPFIYIMDTTNWNAHHFFQIRSSSSFHTFR